MARRVRQGRSRLLVLAVTLTAAVTVVVVVGRHVSEDAQRSNQFARHAQYVDPLASAAAAASDASAAGDTAAASIYGSLARVPAAIWLTPERYPAQQVADRVADAATDSLSQDSFPLFVLYGIPGRDCEGGYSGGGLTADTYLPWVRDVAAAASINPDSVVVVEPDALASGLSCPDLSTRLSLVRSAVEALRTADVTTYVDAGHSSWVPVAKMSQLLRAVGVEDVRGFATNVSNYQTTADEVAYAQALSDELDQAHYIIDTGRNGRGATAVWCNPAGRSLGSVPRPVDDGSALDALVWVKPPGESDGTCAGGPAAGTFWPENARELVADAVKAP